MFHGPGEIGLTYALDTDGLVGFDMVDEGTAGADRGHICLRFLWRYEGVVGLVGKSAGVGDLDHLTQTFGVVGAEDELCASVSLYRSQHLGCGLVAEREADAAPADPGQHPVLSRDACRR